MSNPIINPLWIYLINVLSNLGDIVFVISIFAGAGFLIGIIVYLFWRVDSYWYKDEEDVSKDKIYRKFLKLGAIILTVLSLLIAVIPSEKIMYTMMTSNYITQENVELTGDAIENMVDYIFKKVDELGE
jgi:formate hydrogenlyase subunit 3/multisubunit Na+/H+ antiporter MnhD subunit